MVQHNLFHCVVSYGLIPWEQLPRVLDMLTLQKQAVRTITASDHHTTFHQTWNVHCVCNFIFLCLVHVRSNINTMMTRVNVHTYNTRQRGHLDTPVGSPGLRLDTSEARSSFSINSPPQSSTQILGPLRKKWPLLSSQGPKIKLLQEFEENNLSVF